MEDNVIISGIGAITPLGIGAASFANNLKIGQSNFSKISLEQSNASYQYIIGMAPDFDFKTEVKKLDLPEEVLKKALRLRHLSKSVLFGTYCALESLVDAGLVEKVMNSSKVAIVSAGSNTQQSNLHKIQEKYREKVTFINPNYAINFFDTDIVGVLSELLQIKGEGYSIGSASASGNMAIIHGKRLISYQSHDIVIVVAPLMDLSIFEYQGFINIGAMKAIDETLAPNNAYRPFDEKHSGFIYGQCAGCIVLESSEHASDRKKKGYGILSGYGVVMDGNRGAKPSKKGEAEAMRMAIYNSGLKAAHIDYVNTHGTGSVIGDTTEVEAMLDVGLQDVKANSTKSLTGHGLSAAGVIEAIACLIQLNHGFIHKSNNLSNPINNEINWIKEKSSGLNINTVLSNSFGFGGINTSLILKKLKN
ncbi:beta-ketoacyl synthase N-terminal-like domain-containing protein [Aquimarina sp. RZ0]|uniref:beta-ketoacyl synthase N-terminal-like domain-containing protein n=1 Tax=Aquimarina sp. RZ0 TaxID=2607730 RepID=UPI0011F3D7E4|nr:beta-ketoacyl synthase N-terminal-like domain-containing protein [Aquimarina sp. RZ0]KAA1242936.1 polyketide beta-ketoacyl:ACP synthase [Aquimarina sp. RZ0]